LIGEGGSCDEREHGKYNCLHGPRLEKEPIDCTANDFVNTIAPRITSEKDSHSLCNWLLFERIDSF